MKATTPFLPHLSGHLFGRPPRSTQSRLREELERIQGASVGQLAGLFGKYTAAKCLAPADSGVGSRCRLFSRSTTFWTFFAQVLTVDGSCREALRKLQAWQAAQGLSLADSNTSAYCQARGRLQIDGLRKMHEHVAREVRRRATTSQSTFGRPVKVVDGTGLSMPDTKANQSVWPQTKAQKPGCGFPSAKLVGLFALENGVLTDWAEGSKHDSEQTLFRRLWKHFEPNDIMLGDKAFGSYAAVATLQQRDVDSVTRVHQARKIDFRQGKKLGPRDRLVTWRKPAYPKPGWSKAEWRKLPDTLPIRIVEIQVSQPGFRVEKYILSTTLLDPREWPAEKLGRLYFRRWSIELFFRDIKITMGMDILRCQTPAMVRKEIIMHVIAYNCIRGLMQHAAALYDVPIERISFKGASDALRQWADAFNIHAGKPRKQAQMLEALLKVIVEDPLPYRPNRSQPRVKKRRPKPYQLMTRPRHEMVVSHSRRRSG